jgi:hypothetical protein
VSGGGGGGPPPRPASARAPLHRQLDATTASRFKKATTVLRTLFTTPRLLLIKRVHQRSLSHSTSSPTVRFFLVRHFRSITPTGIVQNGLTLRIPTPTKSMQPMALLQWLR